MSRFDETLSYGFISLKISSLLQTLLCGTATIFVTAFLSFYPWPFELNITPSNDAVFATVALAGLAYAFIALFFPSFLASGLVITAVALLRYASDKKLASTREPLISGDLGQFDHLSIALRYISPLKLSVISIALLVLLITCIYCTYRLVSGSRLKAVFLSIVLIVGFVSFVKVKVFVQSIVESGSIDYVVSNWPHNVKLNGLVVHLLQTANHPKPVQLTDEQKQEFAGLKKQAHVSSNAPKQLIMILCESCYYDDKLFREAFMPIIKRDVVEMRGVSPVYGGGTPNASFEMFSGLPTINSAVSGSVYQEYRDYLSDKTSTLPSQLALSGYQTVSAHNYSASFWSRDVVEPKLGFSSFYGLQSMLSEFDLGTLPEDDVLFDFALDQLKKNGDQPIFLHLATVATHGPYDSEEDDGGSANYLRKVRKTMSSLAPFLDNVYEIFPEAVVVIYGDHKPSLDAFAHHLDQGKAVIGDVPILVYDPNRERGEKLKDIASGKPFYCYASAISDLYFGMKLPVGTYTETICADYSSEKYEKLSRAVPAWVYSAAVFDPDQRK